MRVLVVGAGLSAAVIARELAEAGIEILLIDKREHIGGNCYDEIINNVLIHRYGPHIFHTSLDFVVKWVKRFSDWMPYEHKVKALLDNGKYVTLPANRETVSILGGSLENVIDVIFRPYTRKMWGIPLEEINQDVINRIPIRHDLNELYFPNDRFQGLPKNGYTQFICEILKHNKIQIELRCTFRREMEGKYDFVFNSMPIDEYFDFSLGRLPYRSVKFHQFTVPFPKILPVATVNYTNSSPYTRITEWKHFPNSPSNPWETTVTVEEPCDYKDNEWMPFYPIKDKNGLNDELFLAYKKMVHEKMMFIGRCGTYKYMDMDDAIAHSLKVAKEFLKWM